jgi:NhaP-type Na+/H+ or K+/H+ antiporter
VSKYNANRHLLQLARVTVVAVTGVLIALAFGLQGFEHSTAYLYTATGLLCFGLYMAGYGIDLLEARRHWRVVLIAITLGVLAKYVVIAGTAYAVTQDWRYAVIGMAIAQIDPLSVSALNGDKRMSAKTRTVLNMWASFDDPTTALITPVLLGLAAYMGARGLTGDTELKLTITDALPFVIVITIVLWRRLSGRSIPGVARLSKDLRAELRDNNGEGPKTAVTYGVLTLATMVQSPPLSAISGLLIRPLWLGGKIGSLLTNAALYGATLLLGVLLAGGIDLTGGIVLGVATYGSQVVIAWIVVGLSSWTSPRSVRQSSGFSAREVWHLALAQQNGITAIVLALVLQPRLAIAVPSISLAILVVNLLHFGSNWAFDKLIEPRAWPEATSNETAPQSVNANR